MTETRNRNEHARRPHTFSLSPLSLSWSNTEMTLDGHSARQAEQDCALPQLLQRVERLPQGIGAADFVGDAFDFQELLDGDP